jgi:hypothetical protein
MTKKKVRKPEDGQEVCQRCGEAGEDRRTLQMACFYEMRELGIPFEDRILFQANIEDLTPAKEPVAIPLPGPEKKVLNLKSGTVTCSGELSPEHFYTLRVCKKCRGEWLDSIKNWFESKNSAIQSEPSEDRRIPVRKFGAIEYVSEAEFYRRKGVKE